MPQSTHTIKTNVLRCLFALALLCIASCARQGYPEGGPRDKTAPRVVDEQPANGTLNFDEKSFFINFDEYVVIQDADNNILISPPMKPKPTFATKRHGILVTINDSLQANTTYLFQFRNAIADFTEGNKLQSYEYAFSTGSVIDSMMILGSVLDAYSLTPRKNTITVMLYPEDSQDSTVTKNNPTNITRCDDKGFFHFSHICPGRYRLIAIEDADKDLRYGPNEAIAFTDTIIEACEPSDSNATSHRLLMSFEQQQVQRILQSKFEREGYAEIVTMLPLADPSLNSDSAIVWRLSASRDTIRLWTVNPKCRNIVVSIADSSGITDTLKLQWRHKRKMGESQKQPQSKNTDWCKWTTGATMPYFMRPSLSFANPIDTTRTRLDSAVIVLRLSDSTQSTHNLVVDSSLLHANVDFSPKADERYKITIKAKSLYDIFGNTTDTLSLTTEIQGEEKFGNIFITLDNAADTTQYVVLLTDESGKIKQTIALGKNKKAEFRLLQPGKYRVQAFADHNDDALWTPGNYWLHRQPEEVYYLSKTLTLRANWDIEERLSVEGASSGTGFSNTDAPSSNTPKVK